MSRPPVAVDSYTAEFNFDTSVRVRIARGQMVEPGGTSRPGTAN
ncbi:hypothetical protein [Methylomonas sp. LWB]|nr:hypothetical protein [Methylomonas sp. LWB]